MSLLSKMKLNTSGSDTSSPFDETSSANADASADLNAVPLPGAVSDAAEGTAASTGSSVSGLVFVNTYGSGVTDAFKAAIIKAENFFQSHFNGSATLNMSFNLQSISNQFTGQNFYFPLFNVSYSSLVSAMTSHAVTADQLAAVKAMPATDPTGGKGFMVPVGMARNLGLAAGPIGTSADDNIVLNSNFSWSFDADAVGVLEHEISEGGLGRIGGLGVENNAWGPLDLFRYSAVGERDYSGGQDGLASYFSVDGTTLLTQFHNSVNMSGVFDGQDLADWNGNVSGDAFGPGGPGAPGGISAVDMQVMGVLGWAPVDPSQPMIFSINDTTTNTVTTQTGEAYNGPVAGLQHQIIDITPDSLNITSSTPNVFIHTGSGTDGIDVSQVNGNNVVDGSTGSNFLIGGTGNDTFYMDDRNPSAPIFSTIVNFHSGDNATVWGVNPTDFKLTLLDNQGAAGALGLDFIFSAPGHIDTSFVLAGYVSADLTNGRLSESYGTTQDLPGLPGSQYMTIHAV